MPKWNAKEIKELAGRDFEKAWLETKKLVDFEAEESKIKERIKSRENGKAHAVFETILKLREAYLNLGFSEVINPVFIEDKEVKKQFGSEAFAILDRCYYLAALPRPEIGMGEEKIEALKKHVKKVDNKKIKKFKEILREYKLGELSGDDFIYSIARALNISDTEAMKIINEAFPEIKELKPISSNLTLRSHMTAAWFLTLKEISKYKGMPIKLFSVDRCFRREQREDEEHLRTYFSASSVIMDRELSVKDGEELAREIFENFGFKDFKFRLDEKRSKYYAPDTQKEVYVKHAKLGYVEVATFGLYSPVALSRYDIEYPVLNLGIGVERLAMILHNISDARELVYEQFYKKPKMSDRELAKHISIDEIPETEEGKKIAEAILKTAVKHANAASPCEFKVYEGMLLGKHVSVKLTEREENKKLLGPAMLNRIFIFNGNVYGTKEMKESKAIDTGISYIKAFANLAAKKIEKACKEGKKGEFEIKVRGIKQASDINIKIGEDALKFMMANNKKADIRGPGFTTVKAEIE